MNRISLNNAIKALSEDSVSLAAEGPRSTRPRQGKVNQAHGCTYPETSLIPTLRQEALARHLLSCHNPPGRAPFKHHQGLLKFSTRGLFDRPRGSSACRPLHGPGEGGISRGPGPLCSSGAPPPAPRCCEVPQAGDPSAWRTAAGCRRTYRCTAALQPGHAAAASPHAPPAPPVRGGGGSANGRSGPCGNPPVPNCASLLPASPHSPASHPAAASPPPGWRPAPPPAATASGSAHGCSPLRVRWNQPVTRGRAPWPLPQVIASSSGQSAPSLPSRQQSTRPPAGVEGQRERRAGMFTNKIGE